MPGKQKSVLSAEQGHWPENLRQKYRKLALPAVVAAVSADKEKPVAREPREADKRKRR